MRKYEVIRVIVYLLFMTMVLASCSKTELSDAQHLQRAKSYLQQGNSRAAVIELKNALQQNSGNVQARHLLGQQYLESGNYPAAEKELRKALELGMDEGVLVNELSQVLLYQHKYDDVLKTIATHKLEKPTVDLVVIEAEAHMGRGEYDEAEKVLEKAGQLAPGTYPVLLGYAKLAGGRGDIGKATDYLDQAIKADPKGLEALWLRGSAALQQQDFKAALGFFDRALQDNGTSGLTPLAVAARLGKSRSLLAMNNKDDARKEIDFLLNRIPQHPSAKYLRALLAYQEKDLPTAEDYLTQVLKQIPNHMPSVLLFGAINYARGNYEQAELYLGRYVNKIPNQSEAVMLLAATRMKRGEADLAMEVLRPAVENSGDAQLLGMIGKAAALSGDVEGGTRYLKKALAASNDAPAVRVELANLYMQSGAYDEAIKALEPLATGAQAKRARVMMIFAYMKNKNFDKARSEAETLAAENPDSAIMHTLLGIVQMVQDEKTAARDSFQKAVQLDSSFVPARQNLAKLYFQQQDYEAVERELSKLLELDKRNLSALVGRAQVAERRGDLQAALQWWEKAHDAHPGALLPTLVLGNYYLKSGAPQKTLAIAEAALTQDEDSIPLRLLLGRAQAAAGMLNKALQTYQQLADSQPDDPAVLYGLSGVQMQLKQYDQSRDVLRKILAAHTDDIPANIRLIQLEMITGHYDVAMKLALQLRKSQPDSPLGDTLAGNVAFSQKRFDKAQQFFRHAFDKQPSQSLLLKLAESKQQAGDRAGAVQLLETWLQDHVDQVTPARLMLGISYQEIGKAEQAIDLYKKVLTEDPQNVIALNNISFLYLERDPGQAREYAEQAYQRAQGSPAIQDTLGWALVTEGKDVARGVRLLRDASRQAPQVAEISYHLAAGLVKQGKHDEARKILSQLLGDEAEFRERPSAKELLESLPSR